MLRQMRVASRAWALPLPDAFSNCCVFEGQKVKPGTVLATLHSTDLSDTQLALIKASSQRGLADAAEKRAEQLVEADVIGRAELERRRAEVLQANTEAGVVPHPVARPRHDRNADSSAGNNPQAQRGLPHRQPQKRHRAEARDHDWSGGAAGRPCLHHRRSLQRVDRRERARGRCRPIAEGYGSPGAHTRSVTAEDHRPSLVCLAYRRSGHTHRRGSHGCCQSATACSSPTNSPA